jgi:hypothetical protein
MEIHEKPEISHLRVFADGCSYEQKDRYLCIMSVHHLGDSEIFISGLKGIMNRRIYKLLNNYFTSKGVLILRYEKMKPDGTSKLRKIHAV